MTRLLVYYSLLRHFHVYVKKKRKKEKKRKKIRPVGRPLERRVNTRRAKRIDIQPLRRTWLEIFSRVDFQSIRNRSHGETREREREREKDRVITNIEFAVTRSEIEWTVAKYVQLVDIRRTTSFIVDWQWWKNRVRVQSNLNETMKFPVCICARRNVWNYLSK